MKTINLKSILLLFLAATITFSCKNNGEEPEPEPEPKLKIEGEWNLESINFLDGDLKWNPNVPFNPGTSVKYGPYMYSEVKGYNFSTTKADNGFRADVIQSFYQAGDQVLWYWNYTDEQESFVLTQMNLQFPPYDFGIKEVKEVKIDGDKITFGAKIASRLSGGGLNDVEYYDAELSLKKGEASTGTIVKIQGELYVLPAN